MGDPADAGRFAAGMAAAMERMMRGLHAGGLTGDPDRDFLSMMIPHHEGAVEMARLELVHGRDPLARQLAESILSGQQVEIDAMRRRLEILAHPAGAPGFPDLGGTRGPGRP